MNHRQMSTRGIGCDPREPGALRVQLVDELGEPHFYRIGRTFAISRLFSDYADQSGLPLSSLRFTRHGRKVLPTDCPMTPEQLGTDDEEECVINVYVVPKADLQANDPITIRFLDEVGAKLDLPAQPNAPIYHLFRTYSAMRGMGLVWTLLQFTYKGQPFPKHCEDTVSQLGIGDGDIIYISCQVLSDEELRKASFVILTSYFDASPHSFVNLRVADDPKTGGEGLSADFGTVVDYSDHGGDMFWEISFPDNVKKRYSLDDLMNCFQGYIGRNGFELDLVAFLEQQAKQLQSEVRLLQQRDDGADALTLHALKLEQDFDQLKKLVRPWSTTFNDIRQTLRCLEGELRGGRKALVDRLRCKAKKPTLEAGEVVYAKWWQGDDRNAAPSWQRGRVEHYQCREDSGGYGPEREYCVRFDNGDVQDHLAEDQVMHEIEHCTKRDFSPEKWLGVERRFDSDSSDRWARNTGWFVVEIDGIEQPFAHLTDALRVCDAAVARKGFGIEEQELNIGYEWSDFLRAKPIAELDMIFKQRMRVVLGLSKELVEHSSDMKSIGSNLFCWANTARLDDNRLRYQLAMEYKECEGNYLDDNTTLMKENMYLFSLLWQCLEEGIDFGQLCNFFIGAEGSIDKFLSMVPALREGYAAASKGRNEMMAYLQAHVPKQHVDHFWFVNIVDADGSAKKRYVVSRTRPLKDVLARYARLRATSVKSLRIEIDDKRVFLSTIGKKSPEAIGLQDDDVLKVAVMQDSVQEAKPQDEPQRKPQRQKSKGKGKKKHKKSTRKKSMPALPHESEGEKWKEQHSQALSGVFEEADMQFKDIRQRLTAMNLQRTMPKQRQSRPKEETAAAETAVDNPLADGLGGKAGKSFFIVNVGEANNLHNTRAKGSGKQSSGRITLEIDLHGCTKEEALAKLDERLPGWVDTAMKGEYPWVITAKIVCGGGGQTLAEAVEGWIRQCPNVSNAPKNLYS